MARLNVNPTRMELKKLKARLQTATRGHKLLKDKSDEMIRRFTALIKENKRMRAELEAELSDCLGKFATACAYSSKEEIDKVVDELKKIIERLRSMSPLYEDYLKKEKANV